jgi:hypothetical protein
MLSLRSLLLLAFFALGGSPAFAACPAFITPQSMSVSQFLETDFGTLGIPRSAQLKRVLVLEESSCFDISALQLASVRLVLNNRDAHARPSFLAATIIRTFDHDMKGEPPAQIKFRRNANAADATAKWVRVDVKDSLPEGTSFNGGSAIILQGEFEPEEKISFNTLNELLAFTGLAEKKKPMQDWHAVIVEFPDPNIEVVQRDTAHRIIENTIFGIDAAGVMGMGVVEPPSGTTIAQLQLIKFQRLAEPAKPVDALEIKIGGASCVYLRHRVDGGQDSLIKRGNTEDDFLVLRVKAGADC